MYLETMGIAEIGDVQLLGEQLSLAPGQRRKMIFLNDCNSGCVKLLTNGLHASEFIYIDVAPDKSNLDFNIEAFFNEKILPHLRNISPEVPALRENDG